MDFISFIARASILRKLKDCNRLFYIPRAKNSSFNNNKKKFLFFNLITQSSVQPENDRILFQNISIPWHRGQPSDTRKKENCVVLTHLLSNDKYGFLDEDCSNGNAYICEVFPSKSKEINKYIYIYIYIYIYKERKETY